MQDPDTEICYGALFDAMAKPRGKHKVMWQEGSTGSTNGFMLFELTDKNIGVFTIVSDNVQLADLDIDTASKLMATRQIPGTRYEAVVEKRSITKRPAKTSSPFKLSINILGPSKAADEVSRVLAKVNAFLQHPQALGVDVDYCNPDMLVFGCQDSTMTHLVGAYTPLSWEETRLSRDVQGILESLGVVADGDQLGHIEGLISGLTKHQQEGVRFVLQREDESYSGNLSQRILLATHADCSDRVALRPGLGGLIADVMGLGKTLTILASILHSPEKAYDFNHFGHPMTAPSDGSIPTKATLVVVPSIQLLENWEFEIARHFANNYLRHVRFHGPNKPMTTEALKAADIVITTYATLAADHGGAALLYGMQWYRIVLDEAHYIRNAASKQYKAAAAITARRRWCLSGTPIQNKLEDMASLARFLQLPPFSTKESFEKNILKPLSGPDPDSKPLRAYMEAYCLRRTESCLSLPATREEVVPLHLSPAERKAYDDVLEDARKQIDRMVSTGQSERCRKLFTALMRMRMICNTGTLKSTYSGAFLTGRSQMDSPVWQEQCERCSAADGDMLMLLSTYKSCPDCSRPLNQRSPSPISSAVTYLGGGYTSTMIMCDSISGPGDPSQQGFSTKLHAVVKNLANLSGSGNKAIVFSYWKTTLHILARLLQDIGVRYLKVDGDTPSMGRSTSLQSFKQEPDICVLLMTVGTGAVGLNLTVASQIHIVEPQWNPSVEEQAVARAVRMGQQREVTIFRYVLKNTVEQNVLQLQEKKKKLAKFTLGARSDQNISDVVQDLEAVLDLNPRKRALDESF